MLAGNLGLIIVETIGFLLENSLFISGTTDYFKVNLNLHGGFVNCKSSDITVTASSFQGGVAVAGGGYPGYL